MGDGGGGGVARDKDKQILVLLQRDVYSKKKQMKNVLRSRKHDGRLLPPKQTRVYSSSIMVTAVSRGAIFLPFYYQAIQGALLVRLSYMKKKLKNNLKHLCAHPTPRKCNNVIYSRNRLPYTSFHIPPPEPYTAVPILLEGKGNNVITAAVTKYITAAGTNQCHLQQYHTQVPNTVVPIPLKVKVRTSLPVSLSHSKESYKCHVQQQQCNQTPYTVLLHIPPPEPCTVILIPLEGIVVNAIYSSSNQVSINVILQQCTHVPHNVVPNPLAGIVTNAIYSSSNQVSNKSHLQQCTHVPHTVLLHIPPPVPNNIFPMTPPPCLSRRGGGGEITFGSLKLAMGMNTSPSASSFLPPMSRSSRDTWRNPPPKKNRKKTRKYSFFC